MISVKDIDTPLIVLTEKYGTKHIVQFVGYDAGPLLIIGTFSRTAQAFLNFVQILSQDPSFG